MYASVNPSFTAFACWDVFKFKKYIVKTFNVQELGKNGI